MNRPVDFTLVQTPTFWDLMANGFNKEFDDKHYPERIKQLESEGKLPPGSQPVHDHSEHD
jgi:hypothetical protein